MNIFSVFFALCVLVPVHVYAQAEAGGSAAGDVSDSEIRPFVSRLKAAVRGPQVKLTWQDTPGPMEYVIYRHTQEITRENLFEAVMVARVNRGVQVYIDAPPKSGAFFYAVLALTPQGGVHDVFIPFRNKTTLSITVQNTLPEEKLAAIISQLAAKTEQEEIVISFTSSRADRDLMLFRSTSPILSPAQLLATREVRQVKSVETRIVDFPVSGIPYYYALVDRELLANGNITLEAGQNTTVEPAQIPLREGVPSARTESSAAASGYISSVETPQGTPGRPIPLPYYILDSKISANETLKQPASAYIPVYRRLSLAAEKAAQAILPQTALPPEAGMQPVLLEADATEGFRKEDYTLGTVLGGAFAEKDWGEAEKLLTHFMNMHISDEARIRAHFYRGQALFFQKRYNESFMEFLLALDAYYTDIQPWLSNILEITRTGGIPAEG
jgi:TolA-binding protein